MNGYSQADQGRMAGMAAGHRGSIAAAGGKLWQKLYNLTWFLD